MEKGTHRDPYIIHNTLLLCRCYQMAHRPTKMTVKSLSLHPVSSKYFRNTGTLAFMLLLHYSAIHPKDMSKPSGQDIQLVVCSYPSHPDREEAANTLGGSHIPNHSHLGTLQQMSRFPRTFANLPKPTDLYSLHDIPLSIL